MPSLKDFLDTLGLDADIAWDEPLSAHTTLRIGGPADVFIRPRSPEAAIMLLESARAEGIRATILGAGANLLVADRGIRGIVLDTASLASARIQDGLLVAGAGLSIDELCLEACCLGLCGLEDFAGMPGSVGGAAYMNARCYEREISQVLAWLEIQGQTPGQSLRLPIDEAQWSYKRSPLQPGGKAAGALVLSAAFRLESADPARIAATMRARHADREAKGHYRLPSAGSVFKNDRRFGKPTGIILDELGLRGRRIGGAMVAPWHANIFVNAGGASAADFLALMDLARAQAREGLGIELEPEILVVGDF